MRRFVSLLLSLVLVLCLLAGCGPKGKQALVGTWKAQIDMTELIGDEMSTDVDDFVNLDSLVVTMVLRFDADGTFSVYMDRESVDTALESILDSAKEGAYAMLEAQVAELAPGMTVEQMLAAAGMDMETVLAHLESQMNLSALAEQIVFDVASNGQYDVQDDKLFLSAGRGYTPGSSSYETFTLKGKVLTLLEYVGEGYGTFNGLYPLEFHKAE